MDYSILMQNLTPVFFKTVDAICHDWNENHSKSWGFCIEVSRKSIHRAHFFAEDFFVNNPSLPPNPGPFKLAAAFLVSGKHFFELLFFPVQGGEIPPKEEQSLWKTRFLFKAITIFLLQLKLNKTDKQLQKLWDAPTFHYRLEFLNLMRWCDFPILALPLTPTSKPIVDILRLNRMVMAFTLIIESCYYLCENDEVKCDVKGNVHLDAAELDESVRADLYFDTPGFTKEQVKELLARKKVDPK